jgi:hypothetical protein
MYHKVGVQRLSPNQIRKLLKGEKVIVKHGSHHQLHLSEKDAKDVTKKGRLGKGHTVQLDPYAQDLNRQHIKHGHGEGEGIHRRRGHGEGFAFDDAHMRPLMEEIGSVVNPLNLLKLTGLGRKKHATGEGLHRRKRVHHKGRGGDGLFEDVISELNPLSLGYKFGHDVIAPAIMHGRGEGIHKKKRVHRRGGSLLGDIGSFAKKELLPVGLKIGEDLLRKKLGVGEGRKKRGGALIAPHGGALIPAGYGIKKVYKKKAGRPRKYF